MNVVIQEVRLALRSLIRRSGFTMIAVAALALGIGGTTAVYALVHNVLIERLPYEEPDRLVTPDVRSPQGYPISLSIPYFREWSERSRSLASWGGWAGWSFVRAGADGPEFQQVGLVLGDFFDTLGLKPALGRLPTGEETWLGADPQVVLGHAFWQREYGGDPGVIGQPFTTDGFAGNIVGVLAPGAGYPSAEVEAYVPMGIVTDVSWDNRTQSFGMRAVARLEPGVTLEAAQADLDRVAGELAAEFGEPVAMPELRRLDDLFLSNVKAGIWTLMGAVGLLLLIASANVANLALARGEARAQELAVRTALGAGRGQVIRLLFTESAILAVLGGALGIALAALIVESLPALLPLDLPALLAARVALGPQVLAFAAVATLASVALFGLLPALQLGLRGNVGLRRGSRTAVGSSREARRVRDGLIVIQVALSLILLVGAALLTLSLHRLAGVDKGFAAEDVITARLQAPRGTFESGEQRYAFYETLVADIEASPDVVSAAATQLVPLVPRSWERLIAPQGASLDMNEMASVLFNVVSPGYFETLGVTLLRGRGFSETDRDGAMPVAVIDQTMAERFWPGEDPIGKQVTFEQRAPEDPPTWMTVVGVVENVRHYELETRSRIQVYIPMRQYLPMGLSLAVRHRPGMGASVASALPRVVARLAPGVAVADLRSLEARVDEALGPRRALGAVTVLFGTCAALLSALGIFGVLSLAVTRRQRELGLRMAVGATQADTLKLVLRYGVGLAAAGCVFGLVGALAGNRLIASLLYEVQPLDPFIYASMTAAILTVASVAALVPARRAARIDPMQALREE